MPAISVIVPVYNTEKYIEKCLESILNQTYNDIEIIVVNDGSTDNSEQIIKKYVGEFPEKIKYYKKSNGGLSDARNYGIEKANGEYLCFVDSDDYIDIKLFETLKPEIEKKVELIKYKAIKVDSNYSKIEKVDGPVFETTNGQDAFNKLVFKDAFLENAWLYLYKTDFFKSNKFKYAKDLYHEDFGLTPIVIIKANSVTSVDFYGYYYYQSDDSIMRTTDSKKAKKKAWDVLIHYDNMIKSLCSNNYSKLTIENMKQYYTNSILLKAKELDKDILNSYIKEIKSRKMISNIKVKNIKQLVKKIILKLNIKLYFKLL